MPVDEELLRAWLAHHGDAGGKKTREQKALFWAWERVADLVLHDSEQAWSVVLSLVNLASNDWHLANIAAGPLEELLRQEPERFRAALDQQARRDPKFRRCLTGVWLNESAPLHDLVRKYAITVPDPL